MVPDHRAFSTSNFCPTCILLVMMSNDREKYSSYVPILIAMFPHTSAERTHGSSMGRRASVHRREKWVVVFDGTAPEKTGPKDGTKFCGPRKMLQT